MEALTRGVCEGEEEDTDVRGEKGEHRDTELSPVTGPSLTDISKLVDNFKLWKQRIL